MKFTKEDFSGLIESEQEIAARLANEVFERYLRELAITLAPSRSVEEPKAENLGPFFFKQEDDGN